MNKQGARLSSFLIRITLGLCFTIHGWPKVFGLFGDGHWPAYVKSLNLEPSFLFAAVIAFAEALSGVALILGVFPRIAGLAVVFLMAGAIWSVTGVNGYSNMNNGFEYNLALMVMGFSVALTGPGAYALKISTRKES